MTTENHILAILRATGSRGIFLRDLFAKLQANTPEVDFGMMEWLAFKDAHRVGQHRNGRVFLKGQR